jgi:UDP-N-acetylglucosamine 2-epimerase
VEIEMVQYRPQRRGREEREEKRYQKEKMLKSSQMHKIANLWENIEDIAKAQKNVINKYNQFDYTFMRMDRDRIRYFLKEIEKIMD